MAAFVAGSSGLSWPLFAALGYSGGLVWATAMVTLGYFFGAAWAHLSAWVHRMLLVALGSALVVLVVVIGVVRRRRGG